MGAEWNLQGFVIFMCSGTKKSDHTVRQKAGMEDTLSESWRFGGREEGPVPSWLRAKCCPFLSHCFLLGLFGSPGPGPPAAQAQSLQHSERYHVASASL